MINFLYTITIYPLELAYRFIYLLCVELIGSYGLSLLVLAIISSLIYAPLKKMAARAQNKECQIQAIMAPQLSKIKQESQGAEQHQRIAKLYYRYAYHPIFALRSIIGVVLQVPFLCAAYYMLSTLPDIQGHGFGAISDLSKPDTLLGTIHLLPLLMTAFNIAATYLSTNFSSKERIQAIVVALAFLVLLYNAPAALLVYWTANNAILFGQSYWHYRQQQSRAKHQDHAQNKVATVKSVAEPLLTKLVKLILVAFTTTYTIIPIILLWILIDEPDEKIAPSILIMLLSITSLIMLFRQNSKQNPSIIKMIIAIVIWSIVTFNLARFYSAFTLPIIGIAFSNLKLAQLDNYFIIACCATLLLCLPWHKQAYIDHKTRLENYFSNDDSSTYFSAITTFGLLIIFFSPTALYISSADFFQAPLSQLLIELIPYMFAYLVICTLLWFISPKLIQKYLVITALLITFLSLINALLLNGDYGALDGLLLNNQAFFGSFDSVIFDIIAIALTITAIIFIIKNKLTKQLRLALNLTTCSLAIFCGYQIYNFANTTDHQKAYTQQPGHELPDYNDQLYSFSKTEPNILVFVLDMFTAGDVPKILAKHPDLEQRLSGFVWYEDTVAVGSSTIVSTPSIYAGENFTPEKLNQWQVGTDNSIKKAQTLSIIPNQFSQHNFAVSLLETPIIVPDQTITQFLDNSILFVPKLDTVYTSRWMDKLGIAKLETSNMSHYMLAVSLFRASPHQIKRHIYRDWQWFGVGKALFSNQNLYNTLANTAYFSMLPEVANNRSSKGTLKFFYNLLPHYPWHLPEESLIPVLDPYPETEGQQTKVDGYYPEHYFTEQHNLRLLADFFDWMKANDVYDNSLIILVADHDQSDSVRMQFEHKPLESFVRPHALFMVKPINQQGPLQISHELMATSDVAPIICRVINGCKEVPELQTSPQRIRKHFVAIDKKNGDFFGKFIRYDEYTVTGTMFDENNWQLTPHKK